MENFAWQVCLFLFYSTNFYNAIAKGIKKDCKKVHVCYNLIG